MEVLQKVCSDFKDQTYQHFLLPLQTSHQSPDLQDSPGRGHMTDTTSVTTCPPVLHLLPFSFTLFLALSTDRAPRLSQALELSPPCIPLSPAQLFCCMQPLASASPRTKLLMSTSDQGKAHSGSQALLVPVSFQIHVS